MQHSAMQRRTKETRVNGIREQNTQNVWRMRGVVHLKHHDKFCASLPSAELGWCNILLTRCLSLFVPTIGWPLPSYALPNYSINLILYKHHSLLTQKTVIFIFRSSRCVVGQVNLFRVFGYTVASASLFPICFFICLISIP